MAQSVKRLSTMRKTRVRSLGWEDPLEKEMAIHSSTTAWKIPWTEEPGRLQSMGSQSRTQLSDFTSLHFKKRKCKKAKWYSDDALQIAEKRREAKDKGERERSTQLNSEFQRIARKDKKVLSEQCKEIKEKNF